MNPYEYFYPETKDIPDAIPCDGNTIIAGETSNTFIPPEGGENAAFLTQGACSGSSACYSVTFTGIGDIELTQEYMVYPNRPGEQCCQDY